jgi:hypothetical protein
LIDVAPVTSAAYGDSTDCALRSLAEAKNVPYEDVSAHAERGELRRFFVRSDRDGGSPRMTGGQAMIETLRKRWPNEHAPLSGDRSPRPMSGRQAQIELLRRSSASGATIDPQATDTRPLSGHQAVLQVMARRWTMPT